MNMIGYTRICMDMHGYAWILINVLHRTYTQNFLGQTTCVAPLQRFDCASEQNCETEEAHTNLKREKTWMHCELHNNACR